VPFLGFIFVLLLSFLLIFGIYFLFESYVKNPSYLFIPPLYGRETLAYTSFLLFLLIFTCGQIVLFSNLYLKRPWEKGICLGVFALILVILPLLFYVIDVNNFSFQKDYSYRSSPSYTFSVQANWYNLYYLNPFLLLYASTLDLNFYRFSPEGGMDFFLKTPLGSYPISLVGTLIYLHLGVFLAFINKRRYDRDRKVYREALIENGYLPPTII
jgi:hypothetical protein